VLPFQYGVPEPGRGFRAFGECPRFGGKRGGARNPNMSQQPESISPLLPASPAPQPGQKDGLAPVLEIALDPATQRIPRWLERAELFLRVLLRMYIGLAICYAPWSPMFWDRNPLFVQFPTLAIYAANGAVRGIVSGLGLLNLWIAFQDAVRHRDR
jgi:hypothetical protein